MKRSFHTLCAVLFMFLLVSGCATTKVAPNAATLQIDFAWTSANKCSNVSPEIKVSGVPSTTRQLQVRMLDLDRPYFNHGGGKVIYKGSDTIPKGALKGFTGPCPPVGQHRYSIKVNAVDEAGMIVGSGEKTLPCCP
jgi:phosphatidylethanolamine-binding protein (PEBP) family uncharacterized protein